METARCKLCGEDKPVAQFHRENGKVRKYVCYPCRGKRERAQAKLGLLEAFGGKCMCCGEDNPLFLTLQHIDGRGESVTGLKTHQLYARAKVEGWSSDKYELLCMNCNFADGQYGVCPHRSGRTTAVVLDELHKAATLIARTHDDYVSQYTGNQHHIFVQSKGKLWKDMSEDERNNVLVQLLGGKA